MARAEATGDMECLKFRGLLFSGFYLELSTLMQGGQNPMTINPAYQGSLDGLCGLYAIANAFHVCGYDKQKDILRYAAEGLAKSRWPGVLFEGTTYGDMQRMIKNCIVMLEADDVVVRYPFKASVPTSNEDYWQRFDTLFAGDGVRCAVLGVEKPWAHWIVAGRDGGRVQFMDSTAGNQFLRKNRADLFAGQRRANTKQWLLNRQELIVFEAR